MISPFMMEGKLELGWGVPLLIILKFEWLKARLYNDTSVVMVASWHSKS